MAVNTFESSTNVEKCTVISCPNYLDALNPGHIFLPFPSNPIIATIWKEKCGVAADHDISQARLCRDHFTSDDFTNELRIHLKPDAIPRLNLSWMLGVPPAKIVKFPLKFGSVKEAIDTNERLSEHHDQLLEEIRNLQQKSEMYERKTAIVTREIKRFRSYTLKSSTRKRKNETNLICKVFSQAQIDMLMGKNKVVWSHDDLAMAFTLRHIGNKECYLYLKNTLNMPLPSLSCVQKWVASNQP